jgi:hypothetical protein
MFGSFISTSYNENIGKIDGCFSFDSIPNISCSKTQEENSILEQNVYFQYINLVTIMFMQLVITTLTFAKEVKIFTIEHQNSRSYLLIIIDI